MKVEYHTCDICGGRMDISNSRGSEGRLIGGERWFFGLFNRVEICDQCFFKLRDIIVKRVNLEDEVEEELLENAPESEKYQTYYYKGANIVLDHIKNRKWG